MPYSPGCFDKQTQCTVEEIYYNMRASYAKGKTDRPTIHCWLNTATSQELCYFGLDKDLEKADVISQD